MTAQSAIDAVLALARGEIRELRPYEHASFVGLERLHANESPWPPLSEPADSELHHYPEPQPAELRAALADYYGVPSASVLVGRGSDEGIDLLTRVFCAAGRDAVLICPPTFGMYAVAANIQGANVLSVPLRDNFALDTEAVVAKIAAPDVSGVKIVWLCTPNNPTGNALDTAAVDQVIAAARGRALVVVDEAYAEFNPSPSYAGRLDSEPHLVVLRTLSKAHALAGARIGAVLAHPAVIALLHKVIPPYAVARESTAAALRAMQPGNLAVTRERITEILAERARLEQHLAELPIIKKVWPSAANFVLVEAGDATRLLARAAAAGLILRDFRGKTGLGEAIRISVGTPAQNARLLRSLA